MCTRSPYTAKKAADAKQEVEELTARVKELELDLADLDVEQDNEVLAEQLRRKVDELEAELKERTQQRKV